MRRPGARVEAEREDEDASSKWKKGEEMILRDVPVEEFRGGISMVITEGHYYNNVVKIAGVVHRVVMEGVRLELQVLARGTTSEGLLRAHTADPLFPFTVLVCQSGCGHVESGDRYVHGVKGYLQKEGLASEEWMNNLMAAVPAPREEEADELLELRRRGEELEKGAAKDPPRIPGGLAEEAPKKEPEKDKKKRKKEKKDKKRRSEKRGSSSGQKSCLDGRHPVTASQKKYQVLFAGTGLDAKERIRRRVAKKARKILSKKRGRSKSSSRSSTSSSSKSASRESEDEGLFMEDNKAKGVGGKCPGALCHESLKAMRQCLLAGQGEDLGGVNNRPVATMYFKQEIQRRASGPMAREMLNLSVSLDHLIRGRPAQAADTIAQR